MILQKIVLLLRLITKRLQKLDYLDQLQSKPSGVNVDLNNELLPEIPTNEPVIPVPMVEEMKNPQKR